LLNYGSNGTALDKATGRVAWTTGKGGRSFNVPVVASVKDEPTVLFFATNAVVALDLKNGSEQWRVPFGEGYFCHSADPVLGGDAVYVGSADHGGQVIRFAEGRPETLWKGRQLGNFMASSIVRDGYLYGINLTDAKPAQAELKCLDFKTGEVKWTEPGFGWGSFILAGDRLVLLSDKGELSVAKASPEKFELLARFQVIGGKCWTPPTLANGRLFVRNAAGDLVCFEVSPGRAD
ncbi:MAG: PQQ-binding-like beta-propeller repeat protein, partial [Verrucomicrobiae bacterium]|nr:PQQ-binding-like beta-propeller repeat protein [Verrucomicrobiae bacterium]